MMRAWGKAPHFLVILNGLCFSVAHADDAAAPAPATATPSASPSADAAKAALGQKADDATSEKNLEQVFKAAEKTYSLLKAGKFGANYSFDYTYYRDSRIDLAIDGSSTVTRFRIEEDAQHSFTNSVELTYGLRDNLTLTGSIPLVYKLDSQNSREVTGLGDISVGVRWQPISLTNGLPTATLFGTLSTATGDSPYEINSSKDLSTGKGYYSLGGGVSVSKVTDPIVLFGSASMSIANNMGGLNQVRGGRTLVGVHPGNTLGFSAGFAYSLNYDVSMSASFQQSITTNSRFNFMNAGTAEFVEAPTQVSALVNFSMSLRTSPKRIVNLSLGYGLTEDTPDVVLGFSLPLEFMGLSGADQ